MPSVVARSLPAFLVTIAVATSGSAQAEVGSVESSVADRTARPAQAPAVLFELTHRPGRVRIVNEFDGLVFHCTWRGARQDELDGKARVRPDSSVVAVVHHRNEQFVCHGGQTGYGELIHGIPLS